jgi:hypothetical protein
MEALGIDFGDISHKLLGYLIVRQTGRTYYKSGWHTYLGFHESPKKFEDLGELPDFLENMKGAELIFRNLEDEEK